MASRTRDEDHESERDSDDEDLFPEGAECHGLFLPENERDKPIAANAIGRISVKRIHPFEETALQTYGANDLRSPADLQERWGGGVYQVTGRRHDGTILPGALRRHTLQGKAYAFLAGSKERDEAAAAAMSEPARVAVEKTVDPTVAMMLATLERMAREQDAARKETTAILVKALDILGNRAVAPAAIVAPGANGLVDEKSVDHFRAGMAYAFDQVNEWKKGNGKSDAEETEGDEQKTIQTIVEGIKAARDLSKD